jgi:hypothetical protein
MAYATQDKLDAEVEKLRAEVRVIKKPWLQPTMWIGVVALAASVTSNIWQYWSSDIKSERAQNQLTKATLEFEKLDLDRTKLEKQVDAAKALLAEHEAKLADVEREIAAARQLATSPDVKNALTRAEQNLSTLGKSSQDTSDKLDAEKSSSTTEVRDRLQTAQTMEREGFQNLVKGDFDKAIAAFEASEKALNSYHSVYEIARLLRRNQARLNTEEEKKAILQTVVNHHAYGAPPDLLQQLKSVSK